MSIKSLISFGLLIFVPISIAAEWLHWGEGAIFVTSALAIVPLAIWLSTATEEIAVVVGPSIGALLNAVFGNATELIIAVVALRAGLVDIVKASITGTIISNLLLAMGLSMLVGGIGRQEQTFKPVVARVNGSAMTLAVLAILLPTLAIATGGDTPPSELGFSQFVAWILLAVYGLTLLFSLKTHRSLYDVGVTEHEHGGDRPNLVLWVGVLAAATLAVAYESEIFVGVVESVTEKVGLSPLFTGVILLPLLGGAAEYVTAVSVARKDNMDLSVSVALGSTLLVALFVAPLLVLLGPLFGHPLDLSFNLFELVAVVVAVAVSNLISIDGRSDWLEGCLLLAAYLILGAAFYFQSAA
ncbi:calcium/proton exchanger [Synechococcus elongatus]|uniref:Ca(2+)/H(+) antiporter n=1 Tax=Synechococcus elongatus PCC 11802 TaxID=2283154 RepID=A0AAU6R5G3_SYNEL|nr:calcium/proton exchanger [Synechococcus elongatus]QFZ91498.1 calcium/proton exchanger [Synechococcus elongatus PCC 11802]